jgi:exosortase/archaeosortase family protein
MALPALVALSSLFVYVDPRSVATKWKANPGVFYYALMALGAVLVNHCLNSTAWNDYLAALTTQCVRGLLSLLGYNMVGSSEVGAIQDAHFGIQIYSPCSGLEGVMFFLIAFSLVLMVDGSRVSGRTIGLFYIGGVGYMLGLNVIRIVLFFMVGVWAVSHWGATQASALVDDLFHRHIGWVLYAGGITLYIAMFYVQARPNGSEQAKLNPDTASERE